MDFSGFRKEVIKHIFSQGLLEFSLQALFFICFFGQAAISPPFINEEFSKLSKELKECIDKFPQGIEKIKLQEAVKIVNTPITAAEKVSDDHLVKILQFYELLNECKKVLV